ncbi:Elongation factor Ts [Luteitalea pratensis]|uniref:Elongation factor Ts n=1 Tax=Luteitalea pratensis TaxID=1855912 RepID=A0A143PRF3_LUTPR|nr:translation elongation factor Ts [Luteitalea pratensis]AMY10946.1 Elongation factor Ts [Luteitalea pratensis]
MAITAEMVKNLRERTGAGMMECKTALTESNGDVDAAIEYLRKRGMAQAAKRAGRVASEGVVGIKLSDDRTLGVLAEVNCETDFVARNDGFKALVDEITAIVFTSDQPSAALVAADGPIGSRITAEIAKVGENMAVPRTAKLTADHVGSYSHMGGKIGVLVQIDGAKGEAATHDAFKTFVNELAMHVAAAAPEYTTRAEVPSERVEKEKEIYRAQMAESGKPANVIEKIIEGKLGAFYEGVCLVDQPTIRDPKVKVSQALDAVAKAVGSPLAIKGFARFKVGEASQA